MAPNAETTGYGYQKGGPVNHIANQGIVRMIPEKGDHFEFSEGGHVSVAKAREIMKDGTANGKALTGKQKRYFGWIIGGMKADGGFISAKERMEFKKGGAVVMGYDKGGDVHGDPVQVEKDFNDLQDQYAAETDPAKQKAILSKISALQENFDYWNNHPQEKAQYLLNKGVSDPNFGKDVATPDAATATTTAGTKTGTSTGATTRSAGTASSAVAPDMNYQQQFLAEHDNPQANATATTTDAGGKTATSVDAVTNLKKQYDDLALAGKIGDANAIAQQMRALGYNSDGTKVGAAVMASLGQAEDNATNTSDVGQPTPKSAIKNVYDSLGGAAGMLALGQVGLGIWQGAKAKAPIDHIDPSLINAVQQAQQRATYGFDQNTLAANRNQITTNMRNVMGNISNTSAGDAGMGIANSRLAAIDANMSNLNLASADATLKGQKQEYADTMVGALDTRKRQIFQDALDQSTLHQQAASNLIGAGLTNLFGNLGLQKTNQAITDRAKLGTIDWGALANPTATTSANTTAG
jgi:hypothetical protein